MRSKTSAGDIDLVLRLSGEGGEGVISLGEILTGFLNSQGWEVMSFKTFPSEIRGGNALFDLRLSNRPVRTTGNAPDFLLAMNREALLLHGSATAPGGLILADDEAREAAAGLQTQTVFLPFTALAKDQLAFLQGKNMVCLGALARLLNLGENELVHHLRVKFGKKGAAVVEKNVIGFRLGFRAMAEHLGERGEITLPVPPRPSGEGRALLNGNEAVGLGAFAAGCGYFAGYPISPATEIMEFLADKIPCAGGHVLQMEDELASLASCLGASFAGVRAMTATSGPGFSLMVELIGLASMAEIPVVVVDVQRGGPSTGLPTKTEQSDLRLALAGMHGEGPRAVLAASDVTDCFHQTVEAFRLAEKYQVPVIILSDQHLAYTTTPLALGELAPARPPARLKPSGDPAAFQRYAPAVDGVSPMPFPGDADFRYIATGLEHDPSGKPNYGPDNREAMLAKRARKMVALAREPGGFILSGPGSPRGLISWGSTHGAVVEAVEHAAREGVSFDHLHLKRLHPLPVEALVEFARSKERLLVIELNPGGQLADVIEGVLKRPVERLNAGRGLPLTPEEILGSLAGSAGQ